VVQRNELRDKLFEGQAVKTYSGGKPNYTQPEARTGDCLLTKVCAAEGHAIQKQREWVGLTGEERNDCLVEADPCEALAEPEAQQLMEEVEAKLKEKNG
jgi:hypothetical protein